MTNWILFIMLTGSPPISVHLPNGTNQVQCLEAARAYKEVLPQSTLACFEYKRRIT